MMQPISFIAIYFVIWWLCLFVILPIGAHNQSDTDNVVEGTEPGAPVFFRIWPKLLATTLLALVIQVLLLWALSNTGLQEYWQ
jgi:predicted secreted protein